MKRRARLSGLVVWIVALTVLAGCFGDDSGESGAAARITVDPGEYIGPVATTPSAQATPPIARQATPSPVPPTGVTLSLVGHTDLGGLGFAGNVRTLGSYAYVGSWGAGRCPAQGVRVVDISDPAAPAVVATAALFPGTSAEDVVPLHVETAAFHGDLLAAGIQKCSNSSAAPGGLALVDVTDPPNPRDLGFFATGVGPRGVHELDVTIQNGRVLALLAVPNSGLASQGDFRIVDISDPARPVQLSSWRPETVGLRAPGIGCNPLVFDHSARGSRDGLRAYVSYWDAGLLILDISDPTSPRFLGQALDRSAEGAIHSVDITADGLALVTEEDDVFESPRGLRLRAEAGGDSVEAAACQASGGAELDQTGVISGPLVDSGTLCSGAPANAHGAVLIAARGRCSDGVQVRAAAGAGALSLVLVDAAAPHTLNADGPWQLPVVTVGQADGERLRGLAAVEGATITLPVERPWGGVRVWDITDPGSPVLRSVFRTEDAIRFPAVGPGYYTVHNPLSLGRYALFSWYGDGVRVVDMVDPGHPIEVAWYIPPGVRDRQGFFPPAPDVWGVAVTGDLVLLSDINGGLYVLRSTGLGIAP